MTLRITLDQDSGVQVVRPEGCLEGEVLAELVSGCAGSLRLDLTQLRSADPVGLTVLRGLRAQGAVLAGASPYIRLLLGAETSEPPPSAGPGGLRQRQRDRPHHRRADHLPHHGHP